MMEIMWLDKTIYETRPRLYNDFFVSGTRFFGPKAKN